MARARRALGEAGFADARAEGVRLSSGTALVEADEWLDAYLRRAGEALAAPVRP
jgi:hypothetical protein